MYELMKREVGSSGCRNPLGLPNAALTSLSGINGRENLNCTGTKILQIMQLNNMIFVCLIPIFALLFKLNYF